MNGNWWDENWWLEHLEGETDPAQRRDLEVLLKNSKADRLLLERWRKTKEAVKLSDDTVLPEDGRVYDRLHDKIMAAIDGQNERKVSSRNSGHAMEWGHSVVSVLVKKNAMKEEVS